MALVYNVPITFGRAGGARALNCSGIDFSEDVGRSWTWAPVAELDCQLPLARQDIAMELSASPFLVPDVLSVQRVYIFLGGQFIGYFALKGHAIRSFPVSRSLASGRLARLSLVIPDAVSPHSLGISEDKRELGICLTSITFRTV